MDVGIDAKEFKKVLKIHGYVSSDEETSDSDSGQEMDEKYERYKPGPIPIDPQKDKIIVIGSEGCLDAIKETIAQDLRTVELVLSGKKKMTKNQKKKLRKRLRKNEEILKNLDNKADSIDSDIKDCASVEEKCDEVEYREVEEIEGANDVVDSREKTEEVQGEEKEPQVEAAKKRKRGGRKHKKAVSDLESLSSLSSSSLSIPPKEDKTQNIFQVPPIPPKQEPSDPSIFSVLGEALSRFNDFVLDNMIYSFRIFSQIGELSKFLQARNIKRTIAMHCVSNVIFGVSQQYEIFLRNFPISQNAFKSLFYNIDSVILQYIPQNCDFSSMSNDPENFVFCCLNCVLLNVLEKIALHVSVLKGGRNETFPNNLNPGQILEESSKFNLGQLTRNIFMGRQLNPAVSLQFPLIEGVTNNRLEEKRAKMRKLMVDASCQTDFVNEESNYQNTSVLERFEENKLEEGPDISENSSEKVGQSQLQSSVVEDLTDTDSGFSQTQLQSVTEDLIEDPEQNQFSIEDPLLWLQSVELKTVIYLLGLFFICKHLVPLFAYYFLVLLFSFTELLFFVLLLVYVCVLFVVKF